MKKIDTVLFDLDGTLIDTNEIIAKSYEYAYQTHLPDLEMPRSLVINNIGPTLRTIFSRYTKDPARVDALIESYRAYYTQYEFDYFYLYPKVKDVLDKLKENGIQLGIVTSKLKEAAWPSYTHFGLEHYFDVFIALDDVDEPKPSAEPVLKALSAFDHVENAIMIGDNQSDLLAGQAAGILSAGVAWSIKGRDHLKKVNPNYILESMEDLLPLIPIKE